MQTSTLSPLIVNYDCAECKTSTTELNSVRIIYECLFNSKMSLKDKNKYVFLTIQNYVVARKFHVISDFFQDDALNELHPSFIKSALIMTESIHQEVSDARNKAKEILNLKLN